MAAAHPSVAPQGLGTIREPSAGDGGGGGQVAERARWRLGGQWRGTCGGRRRDLVAADAAAVCALAAEGGKGGAATSLN